MREVQRLADRVVLEWIQLDGLTLNEWRSMELGDPARQKRVLASRLVHVNPGDIDPDDRRTILQFKPDGDNWYWHGARGWVGPGTGRVKSFDTDSFDLEPGDVCVDRGIVYWVDLLSPREFKEAKEEDVVIIRNPTTREVSEVRKR